MSHPIFGDVLQRELSLDRPRITILLLIVELLPKRILILFGNRAACTIFNTRFSASSTSFTFSGPVYALVGSKRRQYVMTLNSLE